jgi:choline dehydrogenase-like flavoprotein
VLLHANVTQLALNTAGTTIDALTLRTFTGKTVTVHARRVVLATGGLETPRLLLANRSVQSNGIGNDHDMVGRYYMCHLAGTTGTLRVNAAHTPVWHGYDVSDDGIYCRRRLALSAETQRQLGIGNFIARLHHPRITDPAHRTGVLSLLYLAKAFIPYEYGKRLHGEERVTRAAWLRHARNVVADSPRTVAFLLHWLRKRGLATRKFPSIIVTPRASRYSLDFHAEQQPNPQSRVSLSGDIDELGLPRIHVDWRYTDWDIASVRTALDLFAQDIRQSDIGDFDYDREAVEADVVRYGAYGGHHLGTARMGSNPRTSVVDPDGRVHNVSNLFIVGGATFPTSSQANPTLTIVALALRLAAHLKAELAAAPSALPLSAAAS